MATRAIYLTVRLDLNNPKVDVITDDHADELVCELGYNFTAPEGCDFTIDNTEICGRNDDGGF